MVVKITTKNNLTKIFKDVKTLNESKSSLFMEYKNGCLEYYEKSIESYVIVEEDSSEYANDSIFGSEGIDC